MFSNCVFKKMLLLGMSTLTCVTLTDCSKKMQPGTNLSTSWKHRHSKLNSEFMLVVFVQC